MAYGCPLLIRPHFSGNIYHDFQLQFESSNASCPIDPHKNLLLIQFTRLLNSTFNDTSYSLYNLAQLDQSLPHIQVYPDDHINLCIQSVFDTNRENVTCDEFYMVTVMSSMDRTAWPLLIIIGYISTLLIAILFSLLSQLFDKLSKTLFSGSITKKLLKSRKIFSFASTPQQQLNNTNFKDITDKREFFNAIDLIAKECQETTRTYTIMSTKFDEHVNPVNH